MRISVRRKTINAGYFIYDNYISIILYMGTSNQLVYEIVKENFTTIENELKQILNTLDKNISIQYRVGAYDNNYAKQKFINLILNNSKILEKQLINCKLQYVKANNYYTDIQFIPDNNIYTINQIDTTSETHPMYMLKTNTIGNIYNNESNNILPVYIDEYSKFEDFVTGIYGSRNHVLDQYIFSKSLIINIIKSKFFMGQDLKNIMSIPYFVMNHFKIDGNKKIIYKSITDEHNEYIE